MRSRQWYYICAYSLSLIQLVSLKFGYTVNECLVRVAVRGSVRSK